MAACLADRDDTATDAVQDDTVLETTEEAPVPEEDPADFVLAKGRAGDIRIGMSIEELKAQIREGQLLKDTTLNLEGQDYTAYVFKESNASAGLLVEQLCEPECRVWRIRVRTDDFKTPAGVGIGSKYGDLQQHYTIRQVSMGEAGLVAVAEDAGFSFILDTDHMGKLPLHKLKPADVPANTLVKGILIY
jgi:hypothetical protein